MAPLQTCARCPAIHSMRDLVPRPLSVAQDNAGNVRLVGVGEDGQRGYTWLTRLTPRGALDPASCLLTLEGGPGGVERATSLS